MIVCHDKSVQELILSNYDEEWTALVILSAVTMADFKGA